MAHTTDLRDHELLGAVNAVTAAHMWSKLPILLCMHTVYSLIHRMTSNESFYYWPAKQDYPFNQCNKPQDRPFHFITAVQQCHTSLTLVTTQLQTKPEEQASQHHSTTHQLPQPGAKTRRSLWRRSSKTRVGALLVTRREVPGKEGHSS